MVGFAGPGLQDAVAAAREVDLAPDDLALADQAGAPALGEAVDDLEAAAVLVVVGRLPRPWEGVRAVAYLEDECAVEQHPQADVAGGVAQGVGDEFGDEQLGGER